MLHRRTSDQIVKMLEFLNYNVPFVFGGKYFRQFYGIPIGTNCAFLLIDFFIFSYYSEFFETLIKNKNKRR